MLLNNIGSTVLKKSQLSFVIGLFLLDHEVLLAWDEYLFAEFKSFYHGL